MKKIKRKEISLVKRYLLLAHHFHIQVYIPSWEEQKTIQIEIVKEECKKKEKENKEEERRRKRRKSKERTSNFCNSRKMKKNTKKLLENNTCRNQNNYGWN